MNEEIIGMIPVLPIGDIERDTAWYKEKTGFEIRFADKMYAVLAGTIFTCTCNGMPKQKAIHFWVGPL